MLVIICLGGGSVNQTVMAIANARRLVKKEGSLSIKVIPGFMELKIAGERKTGIRFIVER